MKKKRAIVCVTNDLVTDQRVHKTCLILQKCGYDVLETGRLLPDSLPINRPYQTRRVKHFFNRKAIFYAEYNIRLFFFLLFAKIDLIFTNDLDSLPAAFFAAEIRRKPLIYDTHEYFTEIPELVARPKTQRIWKWLENFIFPKLKKIITVNHSIANLYEKKYNKKVAVVRNIPPKFQIEKIKSRKELELPDNKHIIILQGSGINVQRGAEEACQAMQYLENVVLLIVGNGDVIPLLKHMTNELNLQEKIIFKPKISFTELCQYTLNSDLGLAIDKDTNINYHFSLPNKLFDYIHSGIPVLTSKLPEIQQIIDKYDIGYFIENHNPEHIAEVIKNIFADKEIYIRKKQNTQFAAKELCWEDEEKILMEIINS